MGSEANRDDFGPTGGGRFSWRDPILLLPIAFLLGLSLAWLAETAQHYYAPLIIFPLLVGAALGVLTILAVRLGRIGNRPTIVLATLLASLISIGGQHYLSYRAECRLVAQQRRLRLEAQQEQPALGAIAMPEAPGSVFAYMQKRAAEGRELNIGGYVARGWQAWASWGVDGLLVLLAAMFLVVPVMRLPYCSRCRSWYREVRRGRFDGPFSGKLAEAAGVSGSGKTASGRYRLLSCHGGCGPTGLEIAWRRSDGDTTTLRQWLDTESRDRIVQLFDEQANPKSEIRNPKSEIRNPKSEI